MMENNEAVNSALPSGATLQGGKFRIIRFISSGGFGCTYEAEHTLLHKRVAIKEFFVRDFCNRDEGTMRVSVGTQSKVKLVEKLRRKFIDEACGLCQLDHPGIVRVSDVFEENGTAYYVMDFIDGESLDSIIKSAGKLRPERATDYLLQVCDALETVHAHNRLHLDIKPANIMIDKKGKAVLIDFGASKQYDEEAGQNTSTVIGLTPGFAPLEQMGNDIVQFKAATDIYSLGATLYKAITGVTPPSAALLATGDKLAPMPSTTPANVVSAIQAAMQMNRESRPQSVAAFRSLLQHPASSSLTPPPAHTPTPVPAPAPVSAPTPIPASKGSSTVVLDYEAPGSPQVPINNVQENGTSINSIDDLKTEGHKIDNSPKKRSLLIWSIIFAIFWVGVLFVGICCCYVTYDNYQFYSSQMDELLEATLPERCDSLIVYNKVTESYEIPNGITTLPEEDIICSGDRRMDLHEASAELNYDLYFIRESRRYILYCGIGILVWIGVGILAYGWIRRRWNYL